MIDEHFDFNRTALKLIELHSATILASAATLIHRHMHISPMPVMPSFKAIFPTSL